MSTTSDSNGKRSNDKRALGILALCVLLVVFFYAGTHAPNAQPGGSDHTFGPHAPTNSEPDPDKFHNPSLLSPRAHTAVQAEYCAQVGNTAAKVADSRDKGGSLEFQRSFAGLGVGIGMDVSNPEEQAHETAMVDFLYGHKGREMTPETARKFFAKFCQDNNW